MISTEYYLYLTDCQVFIENCPAGALDGKMVNQTLCRAVSQGQATKGDFIYLCNNCRRLCPNGRGYGKAG